MPFPLPLDPVVQWLVEGDADPWLEQAATLRQQGVTAHRLVATLRHGLNLEQTSAIIEQLELRERARAKFRAADRMLLTRVGLAQATDEWLAAYKAHRFAEFDSVADLCCGIGGDVIGLAARCHQVLACDLDPTLVAFAQHNVGVNVNRPRAANLITRAEDVADIELAGIDAWHIDPDRRPKGLRTRHVEASGPSLQVIEHLRQANPHAAIKLAPACDVPHPWQADAELEWISRGGECRQLVAWFGKLTPRPGTRRATRLGKDGGCLKTLVATERQELIIAESVGAFVYELDSAVLAAGMEGDIAAEYGWHGFSASTAYVTGDRLISDWLATPYEVLDILPLRRKTVARYLNARNFGRVAIKHRAVDLDPLAFHKSLKLTGDLPAVVIVTRQGEKRIAIITRRIHDSQQLTS